MPDTESPNPNPNPDPDPDPDPDLDPNPDPDPGSPEAGLATAELLGNAALGIAALVAIWAVLQTVGIDVMQWIRAQLLV